MAEIQNTSSTAPNNSILKQLNINPDSVLGADNVTQTIQNPVQAPTDALGIFTNQEASLGIPQLKEAFSTAQKNFLKGQNIANREQLTLQGRRKKLGVIRGEQQQQAGLAQMDLQTLQNAFTLASSNLQSAQATATQRANVLYQDYQTKQQLLYQYPGLDINPLTDSSEDVSKALKQWQKEKVKKDEKIELKKKLRSLGLKTKGSRKELARKLRKHNKKEYNRLQRENKNKMELLDIQVSEARRKLHEAGITPEQKLDTIYHTSPDGGNSSGSVEKAFKSIYH